jgi:NitT/TauT family transport system substrate-binding protein
MKKIALALSLTLLFALPASADDLTKIRVGADSSSFAYQFRVAKGAGLFEKHGFDAEVFTFSYGIDTLNAAILGETDTADAADFAVASRLSVGNNLRILAHILTIKVDGYQLWTNHPDVKKPADLKGKRLGVQKATVLEYVWGLFFLKQKIDPKDVEQVYLSSHAELLAAFQAGEIDAMWVGQDLVKTAKEVENAYKLGDFDLAGFQPKGYFLVDLPFIEKHPDKIPGLLRALDEATKILLENPEEAARLVTLDLKIPYEVALEGVKSNSYEVRLLEEDVAELAGVAQWSIDNGLIKTAYDVRASFYLDAIREAFPDRVTVK